MRCRTSGRSANRTICWMSALPPSSAGCDLPATISCTGLLASSSSASQPVRVAQHQRQPLVGRAPGGRTRSVSTSGSKPLRSSPVRPRRAALQPGLAQPCAHVVDQLGAQLRADPPDVTGVDLLQPLPYAAARAAPRCEPASSRPSSSHSGAAQVGPCTPLVIEPIGTSAGSNPGHSSSNMLAADPPVQLRHPVGALGQPQAHVGHVEHRRVVLGAEGEDPVRPARRAAGRRRPSSPK